MTPCRRTGVAADGRPFCVHGPMIKQGKSWRCRASEAASQRRYRATDKGRARSARNNARNNPRRIRMDAGGIQFLIGMAPTEEIARHLSTKIKLEAPNARTVRNA